MFQLWFFGILTGMSISMVVTEYKLFGAITVIPVFCLVLSACISVLILSTSLK